MILKFFSRAQLRLTLVGLFASAGLAGALAAQNAPQPSASNPLGIPEDIKIFDTENPGTRGATALVNGYVITGTDIEHRVALVTSASQAKPSEDELQRLRLQVLRNVIDETLKIQAAAAQEIPAEKEVVEQTYAQLAAQNFGQEPDKMDEYLLSVGSSPAALKRQIEGELAWDNLLRRNITPFVNVSEDEIREKLEQLEKDKGTDEYRLGEIYLSATRENREERLQLARSLMQQLSEGGSFIAYARQYSEASTKIVGGDTGYLRLGTLPAALAQAVQRMQVGELTGPIEIPGGFSILYLRDKRKVLTADPRDAVLSLKQISIDFPTGVEQAEAEAKLQQFATFIQGMRGCADADSATEKLGARVVDNDQIQARQLPEQLQNIMLSLQVGQATPPFGSPEDGIRVLMLCGRDDPDNANVPTVAEIEGQLREERINKRAQRYLRDLRNDAYIEYN